MASPQIPFYNPKIPFVGSIHGGLQDGTMITIAGQVPSVADRFHVNLQCGSGSNADIALHFNPRYNFFSCVVVTNTKQGGNWGNEERKDNIVLPAGHPFTLVITVTGKCYQLGINGHHFMDYSHRIPFNRVDCIAVGGDVEIASISFQSPMHSFPAQPSFPAGPSFPAQPSFPVHPPFPAQPAFPAFPSFPNYVQPSFPSCPAYPQPPAQPGLPPAMIAVPYKTSINGGLKPGKILTIHGNVHPNANRFHVNLGNRQDIALHFNPRFDENTVVMNTKNGANWGGEERSGGVPFHRGQSFQLSIHCDNHNFRIVVNGGQTHSYRYRVTPLRNIQTLEIEGDVTLTSVMA